MEVISYYRVLEAKLLLLRYEQEPPELAQPHQLAVDRNQDVLGCHLPPRWRLCPRRSQPEVRSAQYSFIYR